ncbi:hypothetical protein ASPZODRAFT_133943, partial [Penicilliopsis zonata CBS 506.65]
MVLRKQPPPHLENCDKGDGRSDLRSPTAATPSPSRLTRPTRALSSPKSPRFPTQDPVFSPDLNKSPAFDLMSLQEAQRSPVASSFNDTQNPWTDDNDERSEPSRLSDSSIPPPVPPKHTQAEIYSEARSVPRVPSILVAGTQRRMAANEWKTAHAADGGAVWEQPEIPAVQLQSNNPFLKARLSDSNPWDNDQVSGPHQDGTRAASSFLRDDASEQLSQNEGYIPMTARLSLLDDPVPESPWADEHSITTSQAQQQPASQQVAGSSNFENIPLSIYIDNGQISEPQADTQAQLPPAIVLQHPRSASEESFSFPSQQSATGQSHLENGIRTPSVTLSSATPSSSSDLLELDFPEKSSSHAESSRAPSPAYLTTAYDTSALGSAQQTQPDSILPVSRTLNDLGPSGSSHPEQPAIAPLPKLSEAEEKRQQEQRSETYFIRQVDWTDVTGRLRHSPILVQNKNGPCPLLALVNALILCSAENTQPPIVKALKTREQISLGLLIQALFDELTSCLGPDDQLPDIEALSRFLTMLHTGMNVNPRLTLEPPGTVGSFLQTNDTRLYGTFGVPLVHGWIASPSSESHHALVRVAQYHEDIQLLQFRKDELEERVFRGGALTPEEQKLIRDIHTIQEFVDVENATQLSSFGLDQLAQTLSPGSVSILFRNDHFSTLYKHPQTHRLFTLVTDAGYSSHAEVVWECLADVSGFNAEFFAGDFRLVGNTTAASADPGPAQHHIVGPRSSSNGANRTSAPRDHSSSSLSAQEQSDADYAYALSLQFQEEERENNRESHSRNRRASTPMNTLTASSQSRQSTHTRSSSAVDIGSGNNNWSQPSTDRRRPSRQDQQYSRQSQSDDPHDEDLPSYEQAASSRPYVPPQSSTSSASPYQAQETRYSRQQQYGRRPPGATVAPGITQQANDRNKDCIV